MTLPEVLQRVTGALDQAGVAYMLTGSFASAHYGSPRSTQDIDFVIEASAAELQTLIQSFPADKYYVDSDAALESHRRESLFNIIDIATGWKIDLIFRKSRPFSREEFGRRQLVNVQGLELFVASPEDMIVAKLEWARLADSQRQIDDVAAILRVRLNTLDRTYVEKWISELGLEQQWSAAKLASEVSK